jgi:hypothetical protein
MSAQIDFEEKYQKENKQHTGVNAQAQYVEPHYKH